MPQFFVSLASFHLYLPLQFQVEHVIREEKMITAYELIEIYCELIAARLPIIESQKYVKLYNLKPSPHFF